MNPTSLNPDTRRIFLKFKIQTRTSLEHPLAAIRVDAAHVATLQGQHRDEAQHIARLLQGGELPVGSVTTTAHGPGDEGTSRHRRPEDDGGESGAVSECLVANILQSVW